MSLYTEDEIRDAADLLADAARDLVDETSAESVRRIERWVLEAIHTAEVA